MKVLINNSGCHDTTHTEKELSENELEILIDFAKENNKNSSCSCQPKIEIYKDFIKDEDGFYSINYGSNLVKE